LRVGEREREREREGRGTIFGMMLLIAGSFTWLGPNKGEGINFILVSFILGILVVEGPN
jgi:hypothetical protein